MPFFHYWKQFIFLEPYLSGTFLGLPGRNITFNSILEPNVKNLWDDVFLLHIQTFRVKFRKITTCGSTCRFEPFFSLLKTIHIFRTMAFRTCLGLSGCNITFKWIFGASVKNLCDDVIFLQNSKFWLKILLCGFICPFFSLLKPFTFRWPCL